MTDSFEYDPDKGLSEVDRILLRGARAHKSGNELSALTNNIVKPAEAMARVLDILSARDWLSQAEKKMLIIDDLMELKDSLREKAITYGSIDHAKPLISVLTTLAKILSEDKLDLSKALREISRAHAQLMLAGISLALNRTLIELERRHPEIEWREEVHEVYAIALPAAVKEIEARVVE